MPYCPNCALEILANTSGCPKCKADFGPGSNWKPLATPPLIPSEPVGKSNSGDDKVLKIFVFGAVFALVPVAARMVGEWRNVAVPALLIALAAFVAGILIWALTIGRKRRRRFASEQAMSVSAGKRLQQRMYLSDQTTTRVDGANLTPVAALIDRCRAAAHATRTCCAWIVHRDPQNEQLSAQGYLLSCWWIDFERPDRFLVSQQMWDRKLGNLFDQWVSIGEETYQNAGLWMRAENGMHQQIHEAYSIDATLAFIEALMATDVPSKYEVRKDEVGSYLYLRYDDPASRRQPLAIMDELAQSACAVDVWLGLDDARLNKVQISIAGIDRDGNRGYFEEHRAYCCHNERISVTPPPWLNAVRSDDGKLTVIDNRVAVLNHYAASLGQENLMTDPSSARAQELQLRIRSALETLH